jgi:hypothetical protein
VLAFEVDLTMLGLNGVLSRLAGRDVVSRHTNDALLYEVDGVLVKRYRVPHIFCGILTYEVPLRLSALPKECVIPLAYPEPCYAAVLDAFGGLNPISSVNINPFVRVSLVVLVDYFTAI